MNHVMVCISGFSGVGKDEFASILKNEFGAVQTGLVDPAKRHMADIYRFSEDQLFGPSKMRNGGDSRYPKPEYYNEDVQQVSGVYINKYGTQVQPGDPKYWLSPREALQKYCELMNNLYGDTWIRAGVELQKKIASESLNYDRMKGIEPGNAEKRETVITMFSDFRHKHEIEYVKKIANVKVVLVRIKSKRVPKPPFDHRSETEQALISDSEFDVIINNDGSLDELHAAARNFGKTWSK